MSESTIVTYCQSYTRSNESNFRIFLTESIQHTINSHYTALICKANTHLSVKDDIIQSSHKGRSHFPRFARNFANCVAIF